MNIEQTRQRLSLSEQDYTDEEVQEIIDQTEMLARFFIDMHMKDQLNIKETEKRDERMLSKSKSIKLFTNLKVNKSKSQVNNS